MKTAKLALYAEHTRRAGDIAGYNNNEPEYGWDSDDYVIYEGTKVSLLEEAERCDRAANKASGGTQLYKMRIAESIREYVNEMM